MTGRLATPEEHAHAGVGALKARLADVWRALVAAARLGPRRGEVLALAATAHLHREALGEFVALEQDQARQAASQEQRR